MVVDVERAAKRRRRERLWIGGVLGYTVLRFAIAWEALDRYGLNIWVFGIIDIVTAVPYAVGTARLVTSVVDRRLQAAAGWMVISAFSFLAPYLYIAVAGHDKSMPKTVWVVLAVLVIALGANAAFAIIRRIRSGRRLRRLEV